MTMNIEAICSILADQAIEYTKNEAGVIIIREFQFPDNLDQIYQVPIAVSILDYEDQSYLRLDVFELIPKSAIINENIYQELLACNFEVPRVRLALDHDQDITLTLDLSVYEFNPDSVISAINHIATSAMLLLDRLSGFFDTEK